MTTYKEVDVEETIANLSIKDKVDLLSGSDWWHMKGLPHHDIGAIRVSDGSNGVRGTKAFNGTPSSCFPCSTGLGSSFDIDLASAIGAALADEARAKGVQVLLGPTVNTQRNPLGGRGFESFSEDPVLNGLIGASYVKALEQKGVAATVKHFVANDQEHQRFANDSIMQDRALREIYLEPFRLIIKHASPKAVMSSYNRVNGVHVSENKYLLTDILRKEWGWDGLVMSDWMGVWSIDEAIKAGLDVEMPGPGLMRGMGAVRVLQAGKLTVEDIDARARNVLKFYNQIVRWGIPFNAPEQTNDSPEIRALLRKAAVSSIVLLKNDKALLPITPKKGQKIAVIGSNAFYAPMSGGGSAEVNGRYRISPLEGIRTATEGTGAEVTYVLGAAAYRFVPTIDAFLPEEGLHMQFFDESMAGKVWQNHPGDWYNKIGDTGVKPDWEVNTKSSYILLIDGIPTDILPGATPYIRFTSSFTPNVSGPWLFGFTTGGNANLWLDGELLIENNKEYSQGAGFFGLGSDERRKLVPNLQKGKKYSIEIRLHLEGGMAKDGPFRFSGALKLGAIPFLEEDEAIKQAVEVAKASDLAIVVTGLNQDWESEAFDRKNLDLPGNLNSLVSAVLAANSNTVVVNQSGMPVVMPWVDQASAVVQAFYGGNELGSALADVLFGKANPSGKLSVTFPKRLEDCNTHLSFGITSPTPGKTYYTEGIFVGYKYYDAASVVPLYPFGHGLSYTTFTYSGFELSSVSETGEFSVSFEVKNAGSHHSGAEAVQVYVSDLTGAITKPVRELKGFVKLFLQPGETKTASVKLDRDAFRYWDEYHAEWRAAKGEYEVQVAASSRDVRLSGKVVLEKALRWTGL